MYIAVELFFEDVALVEYLEPYASVEWLVALVTTVVFFAVAWLWAKRTGEAELIKKDFRKTEIEIEKELER